MDSTAVEGVKDTSLRVIDTTAAGGRDLSAWIPSGVKAAGAIVGAIWGGVPGMVQTLLILMAVDVVLGSLRAIGQKGYRQDTATKRVTMKIGMIVVVGVLAILDRQGFLPVPLATYGAGWYAMHEAISILRNARSIGVPLPGPIIRALEAWQRQKEGEISPSASADPEDGRVNVRSAPSAETTGEKSPEVLTGAQEPQ